MIMRKIRRSFAASGDWYDYLTQSPEHHLPEEDRSYELVKGIRREKVMGAPETLLANNLKVYLDELVETAALGWTVIGMPFDLPQAETRRIPDLAFVSHKTWPRTKRIPAAAAWAIAPDLAVEVISPFDVAHEVLVKVQEYFLAGVRQVWLIFPHIEQVYCYTSPTAVRILTRSDDLTADLLIPGFRLPLAELFPRHDEAGESAPDEERP